MAFDEYDDYSRVVRDLESGGNVAAQNPRSSAFGPYQITRPTFQGIVRNRPDLGLTEADFDRPETHDRAMKALTEESTKALNGAGLPVDPNTLYLSHFLGYPTAINVLRAQPNAPMTQFVGQKEIAANPGAFVRSDGAPKTVAEFTGGLKSRVGKRMETDDVMPAPAMAPAAPRAQLAGGGLDAITQAYMRSIEDAKTPIIANRGLIDEDQKSRRDQGAMLEALGARYREAAKPTLTENLLNQLAVWAQARTASDPGRYATPGGIALRALPNVDPQLQAIASQQKALQDLIAQRQADARNTFDVSAKAMNLSDAQRKEALALRMGQNTAESALGISTADKLAKLRELYMKPDNAKLLDDAINAQVKDATLAGQIKTTLLQRDPQLLMRTPNEIQTAITDEMRSRLGDSKANFNGPQRSLVNIDQRGESAYVTEGMKDAAELMRQQPQVFAQNARLDGLLKAADRIPLGELSGSDTALKVRNAAADLGFNVKGNDASQLAKNTIQQLLVDERGKLKGQGAITDRETEMLRDSLATMKMSGPSFKAALELKKLDNEVRNAMATEWANTGHKGGKDFYAWQNDWLGKNSPAFAERKAEIWSRLMPAIQDQSGGPIPSLSEIDAEIARRRGSK